ncbi:MAG: hypothetical protein P1V20_14650 [Verrucomicrobiales bacterium]|nr:hypothetical protein [Verrucomicrobiales bacterium]
MKYEAGSVAEQLIAEGKIENQKEIALKMIKMGMSDQVIAEATDLPLNTISEHRLKSED